MLFDLQKFIVDYRENPEKREVVEKYEEHVEPLEGKRDVRDLTFYPEYVGTFEPLAYAVPPELREDFDWDLLVQLGAASFSTEVELERSSDTDPSGVGYVELRWVVESGGQEVRKLMTELWGFQIIRLYEIFVDEQLNLAHLRASSESERVAIDAKRRRKIEKWDSKLRAQQEARFMDILKASFGIERAGGEE